MATWKERGVVPDSEDEDASDFEPLNKPQRNENNEHNDYEYGKNHATTVISISEANESTSEERIGGNGESINSKSGISGIATPFAEAIETRIESGRNNHTPSPSPPRIFKFLEPILNPEECSQGSMLQSLNHTHPQNTARENTCSSNEEISTSYVQIVPSNRSLLPSPSSPLLMQDMPAPSFELLQQTETSQRSPPSFGTGSSVVAATSFTRVRSLRQRNALQLHPYAIEQEKYRQTLKARGLKPMRLEQSEDSQAASVGTITTFRESQPNESPSDESQVMDFDWDIPSCPPQALHTEPSQNDLIGDDASSSNGDEFPDIQELFDAPRPGRPSHTSKGRLKQYSSKHRRPQLSAIRTQPFRDVTLTPIDNHDQSIFNLPVSPPTTSPLLAAMTKHSHRLTSRAVSLSSKEVTPKSSTFGESLPRGRMSVELLTPATSAVKSVPQAIFVDSDTELEASVVENSSSDDMVQIRKISKKFRGVLPASHLRLDRAGKRPETPATIRQHSVDTTPPRSRTQRGVAIARISDPTVDRRTPVNLALPIFSDSSDGEHKYHSSGYGGENDHNAELQSVFERQRSGLADVEDDIDAMLPTRTRRARNGNLHPKPNSTKSRTHSRKDPTLRSRQSNLTRYTTDVRKADDCQIRKRKLGVRGSVNYHGSKRARKITTRLSILDVNDFDKPSSKSLPRFLRVAARTARSRKEEGRQSPSKKFIRLDNREDTQEVQTILSKWRAGSIRPKNRLHSMIPAAGKSRQALHIVANQQTQQPRIDIKKPSPRGGFTTQAPRKLHISKPQQTSMDRFVENHTPIESSLNMTPNSNINSEQSWIPMERSSRRSQLTRPAQLEGPQADRFPLNNESAFKATKRSLDTVFKVLQRRREPNTNLQLNRFLLQDARSSPTTRVEGAPRPSQHGRQGTSFRRQKTFPVRIDANAPMYRQPNDPLVLETVSIFDPQIAVSSGDRLQGLGKFGTKYPIHFEVLPLDPGVYFHETSFIGGGRFAKALKGLRIRARSDGEVASFALGETRLSWGDWNELVSSEIGLCIDYMVEHLSESNTRHNPSAMNLLDFVSDYLGNHLVFSSHNEQGDFISRMYEVLRDLSTRLDITTEQPSASRIEVFTRCLVMVYQLLKLAREMKDIITLCVELENLLKDCARKIVGFLIAVDGLGQLRELYDNLQYLSFRESGIGNDQTAVQSWVIVKRTLDAARIPKGSFWDITNHLLGYFDVQYTLDARVLEQSWYSMFTLLPLCEFDNFGVVKRNGRQRAAFDNWALPQKLLSRVFKFYTSNQRQFPGFNDYVKASLGRCYYLMTEWGWWKCGSMIGVAFDFFASQKLAHLRNEEVYDSPRFLRELETDPSLHLEPEDRCFHIFLKIVAVAIKHMDQEEDGKNIRNLVTRILPNHSRQFPKEESIHHRDLASLRNHHDLLCTLYWAAPEGHRPSPALIQDLVIADRSHNEACLINIRAWENLTRFLVTHSCSLTIYNPFSTWQANLSRALSKQYMETDLEVRSQAEPITAMGKPPISDTLMRQTIVVNKKSTIEMLRAVVGALDRTMMAATSSPTTKLVFNPGILEIICSSNIYLESVITEGLLKDCILVVLHYIDQVDRMHPIPDLTDQNRYAIEDDSQDTNVIGFALADRMEMINGLQPEIIPWLGRMLSEGLQDRSSMTPALLHDLVYCWAKAVSLVTAGAMNLKEFVTSGAHSVFQYRSCSRRANYLWPVFLAGLVEHMDLADLKTYFFDVGLEWLLCITSSRVAVVSVADATNVLTMKLRSKGHYLCMDNSFATTPRPSGSKASEIRPHPYYGLFRTAVDTMRKTLLSSDKVSHIFDHSSIQEAKSYFSTLLRRVMEAMKVQLQSMVPRSEQHLEYVKYVQIIISLIQSFANEIQPILGFFTARSTCYWPEDTDPNLFAAGIVSYSLRLPTSPGKTSSQFFHYLYSGWKRDVTRNNFQQHLKYIRKGIRRFEFVSFLLTDFLPAALQSGFEFAGGWILCATYLPVLSARLVQLIQMKDTQQPFPLESLLNLLRIMGNGLNSPTFIAHFVVEDNAARTLLRCITQVIFKFWLSISLPVRQHVACCTEKSRMVDLIETSVISSITHRARFEASLIVDKPTKVEEFPVVLGQHFKEFVSVLENDINETWEVLENGCQILIGNTKAGETKKIQIDSTALLGEPLTCADALALARPITRDETLLCSGRSPIDAMLEDMYW